MLAAMKSGTHTQWFDGLPTEGCLTTEIKGRGPLWQKKNVCDKEINALVCMTQEKKKEKKT